MAIILHDDSVAAVQDGIPSAKSRDWRRGCLCA
jgi:hypothetical protein